MTFLDALRCDVSDVALPPFGVSARCGAAQAARAAGAAGCQFRGEARLPD
jgi:hypothetical protein